MAAPVKAGDIAPQIDWNKIVQSPESEKPQPGLAGQYTVLQFLPPVTPNAKAIVRWNELIAQFRDQPVRFIWIASEAWRAVQPFLREHPMDGWLLIDEKNDAARAYGCEMGGNVIVDPSGTIVGFTTFLAPQQLAGALDGKAVAIAHGTADDQVFKLIQEGKVRLETEPVRWERPRAPEKPNIAPSYDVHISPSKTNGTEGSAGADFWIQRGFDLKTMVSMVYEKDLCRVVLPEPLDNDAKFDFVVVLPKEEDRRIIHQLVARAIEKQFKVSAAVESKPVEVYVMTAIKGKTPAAKTGNEGFGVSIGSFSGFAFSVPEGTSPSFEAMKKAVEELLKRRESTGISNISAGNSTMDEFRQNLERGLGRPVIDETRLEGVYDLEVQGNAKNTEEFIRMLREQTGLVLTPANRSIELLTLTSIN
jgi:uncharacterized protein (TIGR03435 family)